MTTTAIKPVTRPKIRPRSDWGRDLPLTRGLYNFDSIRYDYFADSNAMFQAFKAGNPGIRQSQRGALWCPESA